jgi:hypothetical protein
LSSPEQSARSSSDDLEPEFADPEPTGFISTGPTEEDQERLEALEELPSTTEETQVLNAQAAARFDRRYQRYHEELARRAVREQRRNSRNARENQRLEIHLPGEFPSPPPTPVDTPYLTWFIPSVNYGPMASISDNAFKISSLKGRENYPVWRIQMQDMYEELELWKYVNGEETIEPVPRAAVTGATTPGGTVTTAGVAAIGQTEIDLWKKKTKQALSLLRRRIEAAPMTHVARCETAAQAWSAFRRVYETIGAAAMTLLRNRFTGIRMAEGENLEEHIKNIRTVFDELNIALMSEGSNHITELEFIRQLLASLPESWQYLVSVLDQTPRAGDTDGIQLSADLQSRLLAEYQRRKAMQGESIHIARYSNQNNRGRQPRASDRLNLTCHNCGTVGHIKRDCRKPGGGGFRPNNNSRGRGNSNRSRGGRNNSNNQGRNSQNNGQNRYNGNAYSNQNQNQNQSQNNNYNGTLLVPAERRRRTR